MRCHHSLPVFVLCLSSETSLNIFFSHRTSTSSAFEVITETRYINYLLTYLLTYSVITWPDLNPIRPFGKNVGTLRKISDIIVQTFLSRIQRYNCHFVNFRFRNTAWPENVGQQHIFWRVTQPFFVGGPVFGWTCGTCLNLHLCDNNVCCECTTWQFVNSCASEKFNIIIAAFCQLLTNLLM